MRYGALHADPPWHWQSRSAKGEGRSAKNHYGILSLAELMGMRPQIDAWAAPDCCLFLWSLNSMRQQSLDLIAAWGFEFKTVGFTWAKRTPSDTAWHFGLGYWTRQNSEQCLLAVRGRPRRLHADVPELIVAPRREHSRKPGEVYGAIERLVAGPYLDLFSRADRPGWDAWRRGGYVDRHRPCTCDGDSVVAFMGGRRLSTRKTPRRDHGALRIFNRSAEGKDTRKPITP